MKIHFDIFQSTPGSPKWSLSVRYPHQSSVYTSSLPHSCYMPRPSHSHMITQQYTACSCSFSAVVLGYQNYMSLKTAHLHLLTGQNSDCTNMSCSFTVHSCTRTHTVHTHTHSTHTHTVHTKLHHSPSAPRAALKPQPPSTHLVVKSSCSSCCCHVTVIMPMNQLKDFGALPWLSR